MIYVVSVFFKGNTAHCGSAQYELNFTVTDLNETFHNEYNVCIPITYEKSALQCVAEYFNESVYNITTHEYYIICTPNWQTGTWEACQPDNTQTRTVTDLNNCGVDTDKPATTQSCTYVPPNNSAIIVIGVGIGLGLLYFITKNKQK